MVNERAKNVVEALVESVRDVIRDKGITYDEFHAAVGFLSRVGDTGEVPLLMAVLLEATVDEVTHASHRGSTTAIQGPYYIPDAPWLESPAQLPQRPDEPGDVLVVSGTVRGVDGQALGGAELDMWQATAETPGRYSNVHPGLPAFNLRGRFRADDDGAYQVRTVVPSPYQIKNNGPTGELFELIGTSAWRPAHLHFKIRHPGYQTLTTQLFFTGDSYLDTDAGNAVKDPLIIQLDKNDDRTHSSIGFHTSYDFILEPNPNPA